MKLQCSKCGKGLGEKDPRDNPRVEFTMCSACMDLYLKQMDGMNIGDYLDSLSGPVVVLDKERRLISCNKAAEKALGKPRGVMTGLMQGEFMDCNNAAQAGGCGKSVHCVACVLRQTVTDTMENGTPHKDVKAFLHGSVNGIAAIRHLTVSTEKMAGSVFLKLEVEE